jgi:tetratricopeptide (TPR) repeat protein
MAENARGTYNQGVAAARAGRSKQAEQAFQRVLQIDNRAFPAVFNLGVLAERRGDETAARSYYRQTLSMNPEYLPAIDAISKLDIRNGKVDAVLRFLRKRTASYPKNNGIMNIYADALIAGKEYEKAIAQAKRALRLNERDADAMLRIGKANLFLGRFELAGAVFEQVIKIAPDNAEVYFLRSKIRLENKQKAAAISDLKTALEKRPSYVEAMNNLATVYLLSGNYDESAKLLRSAVQLAPSWGLLHLNYGNALRGAKRYRKAKMALNRAFKLDPELTGALFNLGVLYFTADQLDKLDRIGRLREAKRFFAKYQAEMGSRLSKDDESHKYLVEIQRSMEREETRVAREKERKARDAERAKQRKAEAASTDEKKGAESGKADAISESAKSEEPADAGEGSEDDEWF